MNSIMTFKNVLEKVKEKYNLHNKLTQKRSAQKDVIYCEDEALFDSLEKDVQIREISVKTDNTTHTNANEELPSNISSNDVDSNDTNTTMIDTQAKGNNGPKDSNNTTTQYQNDEIDQIKTLPINHDTSQNEDIRSKHINSFKDDESEVNVINAVFALAKSRIINDAIIKLKGKYLNIKLDEKSYAGCKNVTNNNANCTLPGINNLLLKLSIMPNATGILSIKENNSTVLGVGDPNMVPYIKSTNISEAPFGGGAYPNYTSNFSRAQGFFNYIILGQEVQNKYSDKLQSFSTEVIGYIYTTLLKDKIFSNHTKCYEDDILIAFRNKCHEFAGGNYGNSNAVKLLCHQNATSYDKLDEVFDDLSLNDEFYHNMN